MQRETCADRSDPFECPSKWALFEQISAVLRPGRAQQTHIDTIEIAAVSDDIWPPDNPWSASLTVMQQYWAAFAEVLEYLHQRACALVPEMFCSTVNETRREWETEYGFPDACEHYEELCAKVNAIGGTQCTYFAALAASRGWALTCRDCATEPLGSSADCAAADCSAVACTTSCDPDTLIFEVSLRNSPAYVTPDLSNAADCAVADCSDLCEPSLEALKCLIERVKPAHVRAIFMVV